MKSKKTPPALLGILGLLTVLAAGAVFGIIYGRATIAGQETPTDVSVEGSDTVPVSVPVISEAGQTGITLRQNGSSVSGGGAHVDGNQIVISQGGVYSLSGSLEEGQIYVDADSEDTVVLVLKGVDIRNKDEAAIYVENAGHTVLRLEAGTENRFRSGKEVNLEAMESESNKDASGGAIYAKDDLSITGEGNLQVYGYINNGIQTSNHLLIENGNVTVEAVNNGVKGKDSVTVTGGSLSVFSVGDGIKSDDTTGEGYGVIFISDGDIAVVSKGDAIQAETLLEISGGTFDIVSGDGSANVVYPEEHGWGRPGSDWDLSDESEDSTKGLKSGGAIVITGGSFSVDSYDDTIHSDDTISISGGTFLLSTGDDGVHADTELHIGGGNLRILKSYEGLEANQIIIEDGVIEVSASDDGINANGGTNMWGRGGRTHESEKNTVTEMPNLTIYGGTIAVNAGGDGIDSNGNITIEGGLVLVDGPADDRNGALDFGKENGGKCVINGGTVIAVGSSGMAESFEANSKQCSFRCYLSSSFGAGSEIVIYDSKGEEIFCHTAAKTGNSVVFSSPELVQGETYILSVDGQETEIVLNGVTTDVGQRRRR